MVFANRSEAGEILAEKLVKNRSPRPKGRGSLIFAQESPHLGLESRSFFAQNEVNVDNSIVVGIPRGGVVVAKEISSRLNIPLTVLIIKKLGAPYNPELAIGAVSSFGKPILDYKLIKGLDISSTYLKKEIAQKRREAEQREKFLNITISPEMFKGKTVIVADDGIATGNTAKLAAKILRQFKVKKLILAVGCGPISVADELKKDFDEAICAQISSDFIAVGQFYRDFTPVEDSEVKKLLSNN